MNNTGKNNPNYKHGKYSDNPPRCIDCNCIVTQFRKRCKKCNNKFQRGINAGRWNGGFPKCINCGIPVKDRRSIRCWACSMKLRYKLAKKHTDYPANFNRKLKTKIKQRDYYICQICLNHLKKYNLHIHHIDYNKKNNALNNLITLCASCHMKTNRKRWYWKNIFTTCLLPFIQSLWKNY